MEKLSLALKPLLESDLGVFPIEIIRDEIFKVIQNHEHNQYNKLTKGLQRVCWIFYYWIDSRLEINFPCKHQNFTDEYFYNVITLHFVQGSWVQKKYRDPVISAQSKERIVLFSSYDENRRRFNCCEMVTLGMFANFLLRFEYAGDAIFEMNCRERIRKFWETYSPNGPAEPKAMFDLFVDWYYEKYQDEIKAIKCEVEPRAIKHSVTSVFFDFMKDSKKQKPLFPAKKKSTEKLPFKRRKTEK